MAIVFILDQSGEIQKVAAKKAPFAVVCENEIQVMNQLESSVPAIVLLDYTVRKAGTSEFIEILRQMSAAVEIVVIGDDLADEQVIRCILAGAKGYQNRNTLEQYIEKLIAVVADGEAWVSRKMVAALIDYWRTQ